MLLIPCYSRGEAAHKSRGEGEKIKQFLQQTNNPPRIFLQQTINSQRIVKVASGAFANHLICFYCSLVSAL